jgi:hypothetical protein
MDIGGRGLKRFESSYATKPPPQRRLRIYASDPMAGRQARYRISIDVENEAGLQPGPRGATLEVVDYDGIHGRYYAPVDLNDPSLLMGDGLEPSESDPRFHQQMVYGVAMKVIDSAQRALGRRISFYKSRSRPRLRLIPHGFHGANAYFDPALNAILFGYFRADAKDPGPNLPGQNVYACLSHDIIAHEVTHAIVDRLRRYFIEPTNVDVLAFHEAFADLVALFQRFSYNEILREHIQTSQARLQDASMMVELAQQFGYATGTGRALRSALGKEDTSALGRIFEPHQRGAILVSAVFDGFFRTYERRIADLLRISTGGSGVLPAGRLHPDLVNRVSAEASAVAGGILRMCIRAFDYLPPVDVTFGDFLRALVTADYELHPEDEFEMRHAIIEGFRARGIYPSHVRSLAEESLLWEDWEGEGIERLPEYLLQALTISAQGLDLAARRGSRRTQTIDPIESPSAALSRAAVIESEVADDDPPPMTAQSLTRSQVFSELYNYALRNAASLGLDPNQSISVTGFHPVHRVGRDQRLIVELVAQFVQTDESHKIEFGGLPFRGGTTVVFGSDGGVRYVIPKPLPSAGVGGAIQRAGQEREQRFRSFLLQTDLADPRMAWGDHAYEAQRMLLRTRLRELHAGAS